MKNGQARATKSTASASEAMEVRKKLLNDSTRGLKIPVEVTGSLC
jgi:hypothetical protein